MSYNLETAQKIRTALQKRPELKVEEKKMFGGLGFMVNDKMCINLSGENIMCRFDPALQKEVENKKEYLPMIMKGKKMNGYCYVKPDGYKQKNDLAYWINLCLSYNEKAKSSAKKRK